MLGCMLGCHARMQARGVAPLARSLLGVLTCNVQSGAASRPEELGVGIMHASLELGRAPKPHLPVSWLHPKLARTETLSLRKPEALPIGAPVGASKQTAVLGACSASRRVGSQQAGPGESRLAKQQALDFGWISV